MSNNSSGWTEQPSLTKDQSGANDSSDGKSPTIMSENLKQKILSGKRNSSESDSSRSPSPSLGTKNSKKASESESNSDNESKLKASRKNRSRSPHAGHNRRSSSRHRRDRSRRSRSGSRHRRRRRRSSSRDKRRRSRSRSGSKSKRRSPKRSRRDSTKESTSRSPHVGSKRESSTDNASPRKSGVDGKNNSKRSRDRSRSKGRRRSRSRERHQRSYSRRSRSRERRGQRSSSRDQRGKRSNPNPRRRRSRSSSKSPYRFGFNKAMDAQERLARRLERAKELTKLKKEEDQKKANGFLGLKDEGLRDAIEKAAKMIAGSAPVTTSPHELMSAHASAQMNALRKQAEAETGIAVPTYYNPLIVNPMMFAQQQAKRNKLWSKKDESKAEVSGKDATLWSKTSLGDEKSNEKFAKLMGIKHKETAKESMDDDEIKKRQELFSSLDQQYQQARVVTHTQRGAGLGFASTNPNTLLAQQAHQQLSSAPYPPTT